MTVFAFAGAVISLHTSPAIAFYSQPPASNPAVVGKFHQDVFATLKSPSLEYRIGSAVLDYQAPNRVLSRGLPVVGSSLEMEIVIGPYYYIALNQNQDVVRQWGKGSLTTRLNDEIGPKAVLGELRNLMAFSSVIENGSTFVAKEVVDANEVLPGTPGQSLVVVTVNTHDGYVVSLRATYYGIFRYPIFTHDDVRAQTLTLIHGVQGNFSRFGLVSPISHPPETKTVNLIPCPKGENAISSNKYVVGVCWAPGHLATPSPSNQ
jgi:hypothetical protein